jgi:hypothetical protein
MRYMPRKEHILDTLRLQCVWVEKVYAHTVCLQLALITMRYMLIFREAGSVMHMVPVQDI